MNPRFGLYSNAQGVTVTLCLIFCLFSISYLPAQQFVEVGASLGVNLDGAKDGGVAWGDFNDDGCLDLAVNTDFNNRSYSSRLYMGSCGGGFTDVTATHITGFSRISMERSVVWADINNDGYLDIARNDNPRFEIYLNQGPYGSPAYSFGTATHDANLVITAISGGMNTEGFGWVDTNSDGWLDLVCENHNYGIDIFENPADGSANFVHVTPNGATKGLPTGGRTGDYMALTDYNNDGYVDIFARKENEFDLWTNSGPFVAGDQFAPNITMNAQANNGNKGGVLFADFDNDGDFDMFWGDNPSCVIYEHVGKNSGNFAATAEPGNSAFGGTLPGGTNVDGVATADVNHDGKIDIFLSNRSGSSYLLINTSTGPGNFSFQLNNLGINVNADGEGIAFGDYDNDGDLDLYVNVKNGNNQLWRNDLNDNNFLKVELLRVFPGGITRHDHGATVILKDCAGNILSGIREVNGTRGHGSQDHAVIHFGLPNGPDSVYVLEAKFTRINGVRDTATWAVRPSALPGQTMTMTTQIGVDLSLCNSPLPVSLAAFEGNAEEKGVQLNWSTHSESQSGRFLVERTGENGEFSLVGEVEAAGFSSEKRSYELFDPRPIPGRNFYRLREIALDGSEHDYGTITVTWNGSASLSVYPSVAQSGENVTVSWPVGESSVIDLSLIDMRGAILWQQNQLAEPGMQNFSIPTDGLPAGTYLVLLRQGSQKVTAKLLLRP